MNPIEIVVTLVGCAAISWIVWYFWLWQGESITAHAGADGVQAVDITVKGGYQPASIVVQAGQPVHLHFTRREATPCGEEVVLPDFGIRTHLPQNRTVPVEVMPQQPGAYAITCGMNMYRGTLIVQ